MDDPKKPEEQSGGVNISARNVTVGGDVVGRDKIAYGANAAPNTFAEWQSQMNEQIDSHSKLSAEDKKDLKEQVDKIQTEAAKGNRANTERLEKLINTLSIMAPDIFEVALTTLANPLAGIGLVAKKIGDKAKLEQKASAA